MPQAVVPVCGCGAGHSLRPSVHPVTTGIAETQSIVGTVTGWRRRRRYIMNARAGGTIPLAWHQSECECTATGVRGPTSSVVACWRSAVAIHRISAAAGACQCPHGVRVGWGSLRGGGSHGQRHRAPARRPRGGSTVTGGTSRACTIVAVMWPPASHFDGRCRACTTSTAAVSVQWLHCMPMITACWHCSASACDACAGSCSSTGSCPSSIMIVATGTRRAAVWRE